MYPSLLRPVPFTQSLLPCAFVVIPLRQALGQITYHKLLQQYLLDAPPSVTELLDPYLLVCVLIDSQKFIASLFAVSILD